jgi:hypothetical protein
MIFYDQIPGVIKASRSVLKRKSYEEKKLNSARMRIELRWEE